MENDNSGGRAFPVASAGGGTLNIGMSLRDYFAAKTMGALASTGWRALEYNPQDGLSIIENHARLAYQMADAMIAERAKWPPPSKPLSIAYRRIS